VNALLEQLLERIDREGPMTIADYMQACLADPDHGYYTTRDPFGSDGDFITAPEVSQMFGELLGLWCAVQWQALGRPEVVRLVELGPGRGTLMADALRAVKGVPGFTEALSVHLIDISPSLRAKQQETLSGIEVSWHDTITDVPDGFAFVLANEFLDALPIRQFVMGETAWHERMVGRNGDNDELAFTLSAPLDEMPPIPARLRSATDGAIAEICQPGEDIMAAVARRIVRDGGSALFVDYGYGTSAWEETLQGVAAHGYIDVLEAPGDCDMTAHVNFDTLGRVAENAGAQVSGPVGQGRFLKTLGIDQRAEALLAHATEDQARDIGQAHHRLTDPEAMGTVFKCLAVSAPGNPPPPGL